MLQWVLLHLYKVALLKIPSNNNILSLRRTSGYNHWVNKTTEPKSRHIKTIITLRWQETIHLFMFRKRNISPFPRQQALWEVKSSKCHTFGFVDMIPCYVFLGQKWSRYLSSWKTTDEVLIRESQSYLINGDYRKMRRVT